MIEDGSAYGLITIQGKGHIGELRLDTPVMIRFGEMTEDEVFVQYDEAVEGVTCENDVIVVTFRAGTMPTARGRGRSGT